MNRSDFTRKSVSFPGGIFRAVCILLCLVVLTAGLAGTAGAAGIDINPDTENSNGEGWSYEKGMLTLTNANLEYINATDVDLRIVLNGENNITGGCGIDSSLYGIYVSGNLTVQDNTSGLLNVTVAGTSEIAYGIYSSKNITIQSGVVDVHANTTGGYAAYGIYADKDLSVISGTVNAEIDTAGYSSSLCSFEGNLTVFGGTVTAVANGTVASGILAEEKAVLIENGIITVSALALNSADGISGSSVTVRGGKVDILVSADDATDMAYSCGVYADSDITISGDSVSVNSEASGKDAVGIYAYGGDLIISGGTVTASADGYSAYSIYTGYSADGEFVGGDLLVSDSADVTVDAHSVGGPAFGIYTPFTLVISDSVVRVSEVTSEDETAGGIRVDSGDFLISESAAVTVSKVMGMVSSGIWVGGNLTVSDSAEVTVGEVSANEELASEIYGIYVDGDLTISDSAKVTVSEIISSCSSGINVWGNFTVSNTAEVTVTAVTSTDGSSYGIYTSGNFTVSDSGKIHVSEVTAESDSQPPSAVSSYGILVEPGCLKISESADIAVTTVLGLSSSGITAGDILEISGGTVTVDTKATAVECLAQGIISNADVVISSGAVTVNVISVSGPAYGISSEEGDIIVSGGTVSTEVNATNNSAFGMYVSSSSEEDGVEYTGDIFISGGEVSVYTEASGESEYVISGYGILSQHGVIEISGGVVTANAKTSDTAWAYGFYANTNITISGGSVTVHADAAGGDAYGIYVDDVGGVFAMTNGVVNTMAKVTGDGVYAYGVGDCKSEITGGRITAIGDNWAFATSYSSDRLIVASTLTVRASENIDGTGLSAVSPSVVTEVGSEYKYVVIESSQTEDTTNSDSSDDYDDYTPSTPPTPVTPPAEPEVPDVPAETVVEETQEITISEETTETLPSGETVAVVELEKTAVVQSVAVPEEIAEANPGASVQVIEGNTDQITLPESISDEDVHVIIGLSIVNKEGEPVEVRESGFFILEADVPAGKRLAVGHYTGGIWVDCVVESVANGQYKVYYDGLSPFAAIFIEEHEESPFAAAEETPEMPAESPMPVFGLVLGGLAASAVLRRK